MTPFIKWFQNNSGKVLFVSVASFAIFLIVVLLQVPVDGLENKLLYLLKQYGYTILFVWSILEGEIGLVMGGLLCHSGDMNLFLAIFVAGLGAFVGDQIYFYIGRYNKSYINKKCAHHSRKFALATLMLRKYGTRIIFVQRYMYGMRTIIPISIGLARYSAKKFAIINLISAWFWAALTIVPVWYFGKQIIALFHLVLEHWYYVAPIVLIVAGVLYRAYRKHLINTTQEI